MRVRNLTDRDLAEEYLRREGEWIDEYGVKYSTDRKLLFSANEMDFITYEIPEGTVYVCDDAFYECECLDSISIPSSVTRIGCGAFNGCNKLESINILYSGQTDKEDVLNRFKQILPKNLHNKIKLIK